MNSTLDEQFNLRRRHPSGRFYKWLNSIQSSIARTTMACDLDISYGDSPGQRLDIFPAKQQSAPVFIFIHGGYFRALDKRQYSFMARTLVKLGYLVVSVNYDLAPKVSVATIVDQCIRAFQWTRENIVDWHGDATRMVLCGHSVGATLVAKILEQNDASHSVKKAMLLSGLFDLEPLRQSYLNRDLKLSKSDAESLSPMNSMIQQRPSILLAVGANETSQFIDQSENYSAKLISDGIPNDIIVLPQTNHYTLVRLLNSKQNPIINWLVKNG